MHEIKVKQLQPIDTNNKIVTWTSGFNHLTDYPDDYYTWNSINKKLRFESGDGNSEEYLGKAETLPDAQIMIDEHHSKRVIELFDHLCILEKDNNKLLYIPLIELPDYVVAPIGYYQLSSYDIIHADDECYSFYYNEFISGQRFSVEYEEPVNYNIVFRKYPITVTNDTRPTGPIPDGYKRVHLGMAVPSTTIRLIWSDEINSWVKHNSNTFEYYKLDRSYPPTCVPIDYPLKPY